MNKYSYETKDLIFIHHYSKQGLSFIWYAIVDDIYGYAERSYVQKTKDFKSENLLKLTDSEKKALEETVDLSGFQREFEVFSKDKTVYIGHNILKTFDFLKERHGSYKKLNPFIDWQKKYTPIDPVKLDVWAGNDQYSTLDPTQYQKLESEATSTLHKVQLYFDHQMKYEQCRKYGFEQISRYSIGDYKLPGRWFKVNEANEVLFKIGKHKDQVANPKNEQHVGYIKWLRRGKFPDDKPIVKTKEEEEFIGKFLSYAK